jgi:ABC-type sugar transport system permease subunit
MRSAAGRTLEDGFSEKKPKKKKGVRYKKRIGLLLISPWLVGLLLFKLAPILASLVISFTDFYFLSPEETGFIGLENYNRLIHDEAVGYVFFQTIAMVIGTVPFQLFFSIGLAKVLSMPRVKGSMMLRTMLFFPSIIPSVAVLVLWAGFMDPNTGWLTRLVLEPLGLEGFNSLYSQAAMNVFYVIHSLWSIGPGLLIILGALQGIPQDIRESARVDGAGPFTRFFSITLPMISPAIFFSLVINLVMAFGGVVLLDQGNRFSGSNSPVDGYITYTLFERFDFGYAASLSWVFLVVVMLFIYFIFKTSNRWVFFPDRED